VFSVKNFVFIFQKVIFLVYITLNGKVTWVLKVLYESKSLPIKNLCYMLIISLYGAQEIFLIIMTVFQDFLLDRKFIGTIYLK